MKAIKIINEFNEEMNVTPDELRNWINKQLDIIIKLKKENENLRKIIGCKDYTINEADKEREKLLAEKTLLETKLGRGLKDLAEGKTLTEREFKLREKK